MRTELDIEQKEYTMSEKNYVYTWIRTDLPIEQQIVQAAHSALEAGRDFGKPARDSHLILLSAKSQAELIKISQRLTTHGIRHHMFHEPDYDRGYTSITTEPLTSDEDRAIFRRYSMYQYRAERAFSARDERHETQGA